MLSSSASNRSIFRRAGWFAHVRAVALILVAIYVLLGAAIWYVEPQLVYHPSRERIPPNQDFISPVRVNTPDGEILTAWYTPAARGCPTLLFLDGNAGRPEVQAGRWQRIHQQGVGFLALYYRGYSGSTGTPSEDGLHIDAQSGLAWLQRRGIDSNDIIVHGYSLGSGPAIRLAAANAVGGLVLEAPFRSMSGLMTEKFPLYPFGLFMQNGFESDEWISALDEPVLFVHGQADRLVPVHHSRQLHALAPEPRELVEIENGQHGSLVRDGLYDSIWPFLERHWQASLPPSRDCRLNPQQGQGNSIPSAQ